jgi:hypothetical protein
LRVSHPLDGCERSVRGLTLSQWPLLTIERVHTLLMVNDNH